MKPITTTEAAARGLRPLINPCNESENWILDNVCADMRRGRIEHALVSVPGGTRSSSAQKARSLSGGCSTT